MVTLATTIPGDAPYGPPHPGRRPPPAAARRLLERPHGLMHDQGGLP
jgi:hypothetical protein